MFRKSRVDTNISILLSENRTWVNASFGTFVHLKTLNSGKEFY